MSHLSIRNIVCRYDGQAVINELSLSLKDNDIIALLGPSGCGKTTLLRTIAGLQEVNAGEIYFGDRLVSSMHTMLASEHRNVGMIFQDYALFPHLSVSDNIGFGLNKLSKSARQERVSEMLDLVKLAPFAQRFPHELSGGQQQRVAIARALAYQPSLMLLDEPFSNIDSQSRGEIMMEIRQILKQQNVPAVFVTHSKDEAFAFADKLAIFNQGRIEQIGSAQSLYQQPVSPYVANFMGKANYLPLLAINEQSVQSALGEISLANASNRQRHNTLMVRPEQLQLTASESRNDYQIIQRFFSGGHWVYTLKNSAADKLSLEAHCAQELSINCFVKVTVKPHDIVSFEIN